MTLRNVLLTYGLDSSRPYVAQEAGLLASSSRQAARELSGISDVTSRTAGVHKTKVGVPTGVAVLLSLNSNPTQSDALRFFPAIVMPSFLARVKEINAAILGQASSVLSLVDSLARNWQDVPGIVGQTPDTAPFRFEITAVGGDDLEGKFIANRDLPQGVLVSAGFQILTPIPAPATRALDVHPLPGDMIVKHTCTLDMLSTVKKISDGTQILLRPACSYTKETGVVTTSTKKDGVELGTQFGFGTFNTSGAQRQGVRTLLLDDVYGTDCFVSQGDPFGGGAMQQKQLIESIPCTFVDCVVTVSVTPSVLIPVNTPFMNGFVKGMGISGM